MISLVALSCGSLNNISNANTNTTEIVLGTIVAYTCADGSSFPGGATSKVSTCAEDGGTTTAAWSPVLPTDGCSFPTTVEPTTAAPIVVCPEPPNLSNTAPIQNLTSGGDVLNYTCIPGHAFASNVTSISSTCALSATTNAGAWDPPLPVAGCEQMDCGAVGKTSIANGNIVPPANTLYGAVAKLTCNQGYYLQFLYLPAAEIHCLGPPAKWNASFDDCKSFCLPPPKVEGATMPIASASYGDTLTYTCDPGRQFPNNGTTAHITCDTSGNWEGTPLPTCEWILCPPLPPVSNSIRDTMKNTAGTTVTFSCHVGFAFPDNTTARTVDCLGSGRWSSGVFGCEPVKCPALPYITNSTIIPASAPTSFGTTLNISCNAGLRHSDGNSFKLVTCEANGQWNVAVNSNCSANRCPPLPYVGNSSSSSESTDANSVVTINCNFGFIFPDNSTTQVIKCENQQWNTSLTSCQAKPCPPIPTVVKAKRNEGAAVFGTAIDFLCDEGHRFPDDNKTAKSIACDSSGHWDKQLPPACVVVYCPPVPVIERATSEGTDNIFNSTVTYTCNTSPSTHRFADGDKVKSVKCTASGEWIPKLDPCEVNRCTPLPDIALATPDNRNTTEGTNVTYTCQTGYEFYKGGNTNQVVCQADRTWSKNVELNCNIITCGALPSIAHGGTTETAVKYNTTAEYHCQQGYALPDGSWNMTVTCQADAQWSAQVPDCQVMKCPLPPGVPRAVMNSTLQAAYVFNDTVTYRANPGYFWLKGRLFVKTIRCAQGGDWDEYPVPATVIVCPIFPTWFDYIFNSTATIHRSSIPYSCKDGFVFPDRTKSRVSVCGDLAEWTPALEACKEGNPAYENFTPSEAEGSETIGTVCTIVMVVFAGAIVLVDFVTFPYKMVKKKWGNAFKSLTTKKAQTSSKVDIQ